jgi:regulator of protease activity HflC (stomatin/prohibitin superfamily)
MNITLLKVLIAIVVFIVLISIRQINQYQRGVKFRLGKYVGTKNPGWRLVLPIIETMTKVDIRIKAVDVPHQDAITRDNISTQINAVIYYKVKEADRAVIEVENVNYAVSQLAQTTMRNVIGAMELDELLQNREAASLKIKEIVDASTEPWGIQVNNVELKDVVLPEDMKRVIGKQAEAERERRAVVIKAQGEVEAAENLKKAATTLSEAPGALHLRTLSTINDVSADQSNTIVFAIPLEVLRAFDAIPEIIKRAKNSDKA